MAQVVIFGAGKIARGFLAHLVYRAGLSLAFVEKDPALANLLQREGSYRVHVLGHPEEGDVIQGYDVCQAEDLHGIRRVMRGAQLLFTAVGGKNLPALAPAVAQALRAADGPMNVITCENWQQPAALLRQHVLALYPRARAGFAEAVVMRSAIEPEPAALEREPLLVNVQSYWRLPVDAAGLAAPLPDIPGLAPIEHFGGFLERKFYTYNAANGTVSYVGALLGFTLLYDAATDPRVTQVLEQVYRETGGALADKHGLPLEEQMAFAATSRAKLRDRDIVDYVERNARDPLRKLGPRDRLVGSARLCEAHGIQPIGLATAIAAAAHYRNAQDPSAVRLQAVYEAGGPSAVLETVCEIGREEPLHQLVLARERDLREQGWIRA